MSTLLYISMIGESDVYTPDDYTELYPSGLEKDWILSWHEDMATRHGLKLISCDICRGDPLPGPDELAAVILGGTIHLVLEDRPWIHALTRWLFAYRETGKPLLGICGGHQLIAVAFFQWVLQKHEQGLCLSQGSGPGHPLLQGSTLRASAPRKLPGPDSTAYPDCLRDEFLKKSKKAGDTLEKQSIYTSKAPEPGHYSQAVKYGDLVFVSGQTSDDPVTHEPVKDSIASQTGHILTHIKSISQFTQSGVYVLYRQCPF